MRLVCLSLALAMMVAVAHLTPVAGQDARLTVDIAALEREGESLRAIVNILGPSGGPAGDVAAGSVVARLNGAEARVEGVGRAVNASYGMDITLVIDTSSSMTGGLARVKSAARSFVEGLAPQDRVAVITFDDQIRTAQDFTGDKAAAIDAVNGIEAKGSTELYKAALEGVWAASAAASPRKAVILLSDGIDQGKGSVSRADSLAAIRTLGVPVYAVGLGGMIDRGYLAELAQATHGQFLEAPSPEELSKLYEGIASFLRGQYIVTIEASNVDFGRTITVQLDVVAEGLRGSGSRAMEPGASGTGSLEVTLSGVGSGDRLSQETTVRAEVSPADRVLSVVFSMDGAVVQRSEGSPPYEVTLEPGQLASGRHTLKVEALTAQGATGSAEVQFRTGAAGGVSSKLALLVGALVAAAVAVVACCFALRRLRMRPTRGGKPAEALSRIKEMAKASAGAFEEMEELPAMRERVADPTGVLKVMAGSLAGESFQVGAKPTSIGSGYRCTIILPDRGGLTAEEVRVWVRKGRLMVHRLSRLTETPEEADNGGWSILASGEQFQVASQVFRFELLRAESDSGDAQAHAPSVMRSSAQDEVDVARGA